MEHSPRGEFGTRGVLVEFAYRLQDRHARARGTLGVVVVRLRPAEISHHAVAKVLGDTSAEALDGLRRRDMVLADDLPPLFGIEMAGYFARAAEIAKQHRQMPAFAASAPAFSRLPTNRPRTPTRGAP